MEERKKRISRAIFFLSISTICSIIAYYNWLIQYTKETIKRWSKFFLNKKKTLIHWLLLFWLKQNISPLRKLNFSFHKFVKNTVHCAPNCFLLFLDCTKYFKCLALGHLQLQMPCASISGLYKVPQSYCREGCALTLPAHQKNMPRHKIDH